ncbi:cohesin-loading factor complex subunit SCC2 [Sporobolomyces koalae]|uniref:cohesin-loading factor complex subunit SCC2 n=1 Tax=Sporobolomyces koalae TaxID=500713 RepID=UPI00316FDBE4
MVRSPGSNGYNLPPPPPRPAGSTQAPASPVEEEDAQRRIEREARNVLRGYPVAAGLVGVADVVSHLDPLAPRAPSFFPTSSASSLQAYGLGMIPNEPLFDEYARELHVLLADTSIGTAENYWRQNELNHLAQNLELRKQLAVMHQSEIFASLIPALVCRRPPLAPPFPFVPSQPVAPTASASDLSHQFLQQSGFPYAPLPTTAANPASSTTTASSNDTLAFLESFLDEQMRRRPDRAITSSSVSQSSSPIKVDRLPPLPASLPPTPSHPRRTQSIQNQHYQQSSPDPLMLGANGSPPIRSLSQQARPRAEGANYLQRNGHSNGTSYHNGLREHSPFKNQRPPALESSASPFARIGVPGPSSSLTSPSSALGEAFAEEAGVESAVKRIRLASGTRGSSTFASGGSTGPRVVAGGSKRPVDRFSDLVSDIFSADDSHILDTSSSALGVAAGKSEFRSPSRTTNVNAQALFRSTAVAPTDSAPLLTTAVLTKLLKNVLSISAKGQGAAMLEEMEDSGIGRLLKVLERSWDGVCEQKYWSTEVLKALDEDDGTEGAVVKGKKKAKGKSVTPGKRGAKKKKSIGGADDEELEAEESRNSRRDSAVGERKRSSRSLSRSRSPTVQQDLDESEFSQNSTAAAWDSESLNSVQRCIRNLSDALLAIRIALAILTLGDVSLPKHLFSSDFLQGLLAVLRHALDSFFNPILESPTGCALDDLFKPGMSDHTDKVTEVCDSLAMATELLSSLIKQEEMADDLVNAAIFYSLDPFCHEGTQMPVANKRKNSMSSTITGKSEVTQHALKSLRMCSLNLIRRIYARYDGQRASIVEEVLSNLGRGDTASSAKRGKGAIRLRTNASIQIVSALLLHLVQTCSADLSHQVEKAFSTDDTLVTAKDENGDLEMDQEDNATGTDQLVFVHQHILEPAYDSAVKSARAIIDVLLERSSKVGKSAAGTADSEYRKVLDNLVVDLLATLHLPEWPGAEVFLGVFCRYMIAVLGDTKTTAEANSLRALALDHLGSIAARLRRDSQTQGKEALKSLNEILAEGDVAGLEKLFDAQSCLLAHLERLERTSTNEQGAAVFARVLIARDLSKAREACPNAVHDFDAEDDGRFSLLQNRLDEYLRAVWTTSDAEDVFGPMPPEDAQSRIDALAIELARSQSLASMYQTLIGQIVQASENPQVTLRTKALRAISLVVAQDPDLFLQDNVRQSIENRIHDLSPAVRDTTIELVGKHLVHRPDLAVRYLPQLIGRLSDSGLSVRRRVVKLLRELYGIVSEDEHRTQICRHLFGRVLDEDDGVKDLAIEAIEDLWFAPPAKTATLETSVSSLSNIILSIAGISEGRIPPVEEALRVIVAKHAEKGTSASLDLLKDVLEHLIDSLIVDNKTMNVVACIKTISILSGVDPSLLSTAKASLLVPFLKGASTSEEKIVSDYLLKIFRESVLAMPKTSSKFGRDLQAALLPMLNRPSTQTIQAVISCFAAVVWSQTHDFSMLVKVFCVSTSRLLQEKAKLQDPTRRKQVNLAQFSVVCYLASILCEHGSFDKMRAETPALDRLTPDSIADYVFDNLVEIYKLDLPSETQSAVLTSLSFIWRAHPTLMLEPSSVEIIDAGFESSDRATQLHVLRIIQDFLAAQERSKLPMSVNNKKQKKTGTAVRMDELVGNVEGFADSGVASAIAQRYLDKILQASLTAHPQTQRVGVDVIAMIAQSGFIHPLSLAPTLVALTASADPHVAAKANSTLTTLHQKHASLLVTRFLEPAKASFAYAKVQDGPAATARGYRGNPPDSCFSRWFSLIHKEKRQIQLDYLKQLCRSFDLEPGATCTEDDLRLARFIAEAMSTLDFKRAEEPMLVISRLNTVLAMSGLQVLHLLEEGLAGRGGLLSDATMEGPPQGAGESVPPIDLARQSVICGLTVLLRDHLKQLYSINDAKMAKYAVGKKSAAGDKACSRRSDVPFALGEQGYARMPFAANPLVSPDDLCAQRANYITLIHEDGTMNALEDGSDDDDEIEA